MNQLDAEYQERFAEGLLDLIIKSSIVEVDGQRIGMIRGAEVIDTMLSTIAVLSAGSAETASASKTRRLCDEIARKLQRRIGEAQRQPSPFETIIPGATN